MTQRTVIIYSNSIDPPSLEVSPGDSVKFELQRPDKVTVEFDTSVGSPFPSSDIPLDGSSSLTAQSSQVIELEALGTYGFKVVPEVIREPPGHPDPPAGTLSGDIDVTPDR